MLLLAISPESCDPISRWTNPCAAWLLWRRRFDLNPPHVIACSKMCLPPFDQGISAAEKTRVRSINGRHSSKPYLKPNKALLLALI